jgi:hypothetical protein
MPWQRVSLQARTQVQIQIHIFILLFIAIQTIASNAHYISFITQIYTELACDLRKVQGIGRKYGHGQPGIELARLCTVFPPVFGWWSLGRTMPPVQEVTNRCRLSWLTNRWAQKWGGGGGCGVSANECSCAHGAQINFRDLTPYLTYGCCTDIPGSVAPTRATE